MFVLASIPAPANVVQWDVVAGGGGEMTGGTNTLTATVTQTAAGLSVSGANEASQGYQIALPLPPAAECEINGVACDTGACYGTSDGAFTFENAAGCATPACAFHRGATQYYRYLWQISDIYTHGAIQAGASWSDVNGYCPGGTCGKLGTSMSVSATSSGTWYLVLRSYNGGIIGGDLTLGGYSFDTAGPDVGAVATSNYSYNDQYVSSNYTITMSSISDVGCAGMGTCEYTVNGGGAWSAGSYSGGTCETTNVACSNGAALVINMRASDAKGNATTATAVNRTCDTLPPATTDNANTDWRNTDMLVTLTPNDALSGVAGTVYCVDTTGTCSPSTAYTAPVNVTCAAGTVCPSQYVRYYSTDNVNNAEAVESTVAIRIDKQAPTTTDNADNDWRNTDMLVTLTADDGTGSGIAGTEYCVDTVGTCSPGTAYSGPITVTCAANTVCPAQYVRYRSTDIAGNVEAVKTSVAIRIDKQLPVSTINGPAAGSWHKEDFTIDVSDTDGTGLSGIASCQYQVESYNGASWVVTQAYTARTACNSATSQTITVGAAANCRHQGTNLCRVSVRSTDNATNVSTVNQRLFSIDWTAPNNVASVSAWDSSAKSVSLTSGNSYTYNGPTGPYFEWTAPSDNPAGDNSGVHGYFVYFGTNSLADPTDFQLGTTFTNPTALTAGTTYYLIIKTDDNAGNVSTGSGSPLFVYTYIVATPAYLRVTELDSDATDEPDGILNLTGSNTEERVRIILYSESNLQHAYEPGASMSVTVALNNITTSGAYISATSLGGATPGPGVTSVTGTLSGGEGWIKIKAAAAQDEAVEVTATGSGLTGVGGRDQAAYILVRDDTSVQVLVGEMDSDVLSPTAGDTVMHPVWSHAGTSIVVPMREGAADYWNLYKLEWSGGAWQAPVKLTNNDMRVQPNVRASFTPDDQYVLFSGYSTTTTLPGYPTRPRLLAVKSDGSDSARTVTWLKDNNQLLADNPTAIAFSWDAAWSRTGCAQNADTLAVSYSDGIVPMKGIQLFKMSGSKNAKGLYTETGSTMTQLTNLGRWNYAMHPTWSKDCSKLAFVVWFDAPAPSKTGIYMIDPVAVSPLLPLTITHINNYASYPGVIDMVQECTPTSCVNGSALFPSFTDDGTMITYMVDPDNSFDFNKLTLAGFQGQSVASTFFNGVNFDNYIEYIDDDIYSPQLLGQSENNEFGLVQCLGAGCPKSTNGNIFSYVTQKTGTRDGKLAFLELGDQSAVTNNTGGLLFQNGAVTAVIPPGALISDEVKLQVATPAAPSSPDGKDLLVQIGTAREFFPDGVVFTKDIRLVFRFCDADDDGFLDTVQDADCTGGGGTIPINSIYVYYWCDAGSTVCSNPGNWMKLDGSIDPVGKTITAVTNHFSLYSGWGLTRGRVAPQAFVELNMVNLHTYPNPYRSSAHGNVTFSADAAESTYNAGGTIVVDAQIYDIRGRLVRSAQAVHAGNIPSPPGVGLTLLEWDGKNNAGRNIASGVYPYIISVFDGVFKKTYTGKLSVVN